MRQKLRLFSASILQLYPGRGVAVTGRGDERTRHQSHPRDSRFSSNLALLLALSRLCLHRLLSIITRHPAQSHPSPRRRLSIITRRPAPSPPLPRQLLSSPVPHLGLSHLTPHRLLYIIAHRPALSLLFLHQPLIESPRLPHHPLLHIGSQ